MPDEIAIPATTLLGVEEADEVTSERERRADSGEDAGHGEAATAEAGASADPTDKWSEATGSPEDAKTEPSEDGAEDPGPVEMADPADEESPVGRTPADDGGRDEDAEEEPARLVSRPLGQAPLLDSEPLPATRPGMLRPRAGEDGPFSLPTQRPAFDLGSGAPADIT
ncbi:hypothetical protein [Paractinoplanes brasiliensis]|uniref:hypothetical protein n=1 Tax=Paractinoplanes brasiliensis TaxID=52695 RepID=UPI003F694A7C